ncbi:PLP-dependent aminotransferase family protein [Bordetella trematum]|uniref:aminotransferase-like domain-containing protein n=1 Tax=Bordetella trematum TaxID=123899 RepID=UPI0014050274|nr:PLP-dependent aminotransferase family protein [Bordetella trematum]QIM71593.1 PLP-dependent aminotransferase family protein [Bordetella trematum]
MYSFSRAFVHPQSSPIRDLFKYLSDPEMISFAGGYPDPRLFDAEGLQQASERAFQDSLVCLQYGSTEGTARLRTQIQALMAERGAQVALDQIQVTTGSQQAFDLLLRVMLDDGDLVYAESPAYPNNIQALRVLGARIEGVPVDSDGLVVERLEEMLRAGGRPKLVYTVPTFGNPTGATLSLARRRRLLELAVEFRFLVVEDDPYGDLRFSGEPLPSLLALAPQIEGASQWLVHLASLSKIVAPGLRVAWSIAPVEITRRCTIAKQSADVGSSPWTQSIAAEYLASGRLPAHLARICQAYGEKCAVMADALREKMGEGIEFHAPQGGMFLWARLKDGVTSANLIKACIERKVMFVPGTGFHVGQADASTLRLSFTAPSADGIREGIDRMARAWQAVRASA